MVDRGLTVVDKLVTDGDSVDDTPVVSDGRNQGLEAVLKIGDIKDSQKELLSGGKGSLDIFDLRAVNAVDTNDFVVGELCQVRFDFVSGFAAANLVGRVYDTLGSAVERAGGCRGRGRRSTRQDY